MKNLKSLTIIDILANRLGSTEKAERLLGTVQEAIDKAGKDADLRKVVHKALCESDVTDIEVYHLILCLPAIPKPVVPTND